MTAFRMQIDQIMGNDYNTKEWDYNNAVNTFFHAEYSKNGCPDLFYAFESENINVELANSYGGEGMGDQYWSVYKFSRGDDVEYLKFDGWYQSYNGAEFNDMFWVKPKEVVVIKFVEA